MSITLPRARVLPATIVVMGLLLTTKSVGLLQEAMASTAAQAEAPGQPSGAKPADAVAPVTPASGPVAATAAPTPAPRKDAPPGTAPTAPMSDAERNLLLDLRHRRELLDARERAMGQRDAVMQAAQSKLATKVGELNVLQTKLEALEAARQSHDSANWTSLVHIYETMKPRDAATIFDALDMQVLLGVLDRMAERKAAPILAAMQPERARLATQMLAELRTRAVTPAGETQAAPVTGLQTGTTSLPAPDPKG
jgi:flagellar motility protein MotE (MotC chaperone)